MPPLSHAVVADIGGGGIVEQTGTAAQTSITMDDLSDGLLVSFDPTFSADLAGIVFEVCPMADGALFHTAHPSNGGYEYCTIRTRIGKAHRWAYRHARLSNLIAARITSARPDGKAPRP